MNKKNRHAFGGSEKKRAGAAHRGSVKKRAANGSFFVRWNTCLCLLLLAFLPFVFFHKVLLDPDMMINAGDIVLLSCASKFVQWHSFSDWGKFPLWDPSVCCGQSIVGAMGPQLNIPQWLFWITPSPVLFGWLLWFYAAAGAWGMFLFAKRKGCDPYGAMLAAVVFVLGGKMAAHLYAGHLEVLAGVFCLPWVLLATDCVLDRPSFLRAAFLGAMLALMSTCGHAQILYLHFLFVGIYALLWLALEIRGRGWWATARSTLFFSAGIVAFLVFAAPWWFPVVRQTLLMSGRAQGTDYSFSSQFGPNYVDLLHLIWPFHETGRPLSPGFGKNVGEFDFCFWEKTIYLGTIPLALLLPACLEARKNRPILIIMTVLLVLTFTLGLGNRGPLFWLTTRVLPGYGMFRCPGRQFFYTTFFAALLVGLFVSGKGETTRKWIMFAVSGTLLALVTVGALVMPRIEKTPTAFAWLPVILLACFVAVIVLWMRGILSDNLWKSAVLLLVCCDLYIIWQNHIPVIRTEDIFATGPVKEYLVDKKPEGEFRFLAEKGIIKQSVAAKYGLETPGGYNPGIYGRYLDLYKRIWKSDASTFASIQDHVPSDIAHPVILDLMNVAYFVDAPEEPQPQGTKAVELPGSTARLYRRDTALPRVCIVPKADVPAPGSSTLDALCRMDPRAGCLVEERPFAGGDAFRSLPFERKSASDLTTRFTSEKGGVVLISQAWHPDWRATDHGKPVEVRQVNYDFVGVCVGPGDHEIRVWYRPWDFYLGCGIAAVAWALLAVAVAWGPLRRLRRTAAA